jgi:hypothetical protein
MTVRFWQVIAPDTALSWKLVQHGKERLDTSRIAKTGVSGNNSTYRGRGEELLGSVGNLLTTEYGEGV